MAPPASDHLPSHIAELLTDIVPASAPLRVAVVGTGYVGLVTGACLATMGHIVECIDQDAERITWLRDGRVPFYEPGLAELVAHLHQAAEPSPRRLRFSIAQEAAIAEAEVVFLAVGTPMTESRDAADLRQLMSAASTAASRMRPRGLLVIKSTVPVGTGDAIERMLGDRSPDAKLEVASNPEFLREGKALEDFLRPSRIVIGCNSMHAQALLERIYEPLTAGGAPLIASKRRSAELVKYASNAFLATKLAFINEMADLCERVEADIEAIAEGIGLDPRIGRQYLRAGPGHGGSCLPKDLIALSHTAQQHSVPLRIVDTVRQLNEARQARMVEKIRAACEGKLEGKTIVVLGAAFKPDTDDIRESPALTIIQELARQGAHVRVTDPQALPHVRRRLPHVATCDDAYECAVAADAVVLVTEWQEFAELDLRRLRSLMKGSALVDLRNAFDPVQAGEAGLLYTGVGRCDVAKVTHDESADTVASAEVDEFAQCANGRRLYVLSGDQRATRLKETRGNVNPDTLATWHALVAQGDWTHVFDVGANYGEMLLNLDWPATSALVAFEANPWIAPLLRRSLSEAGLKATVVAQAIAEEAGVMPMLIDRTWSGMSRLGANPLPDGRDHQLQSILVPVTTLRHALDGVDLGSVRLLMKVDVEGAELSVLRGLGDTPALLADFACLIEVMHLDPSTIQWLSERFQIEIFDPVCNALIPVHGPSERLVQLLNSGAFHKQDVVLRRKAARPN